MLKLTSLLRFTTKFMLNIDWYTVLLNSYKLYVKLFKSVLVTRLKKN